MENLWVRRQHSCRTSAMIALMYLLSLTAITRASVMFQDQMPKWVTSETYYTDLRTFHGESLTAMSLSNDRQQLYLGSKNIFYIMDLSQSFASPASVTNTSWGSSTSDISSCMMKGKQPWQCQNFIQVVLKNTVTDRLLVCGTNAWAPSCRNFEPNSLRDFESFSGLLRCPYSPSQKSTALFADGGLYTATVTGFTAVDSTIARSMKGSLIRSNQVDTKWLKVPEFINSFEVGDWVVFFFREIAIEHVNSGEAIYSRVAKVCKNDLGGGWVLEGTWTTFQKARLNCSFPGAFPFYFNYLQDVYMVGEGDNIQFYTVFTTGNHEIPGSAVCVFSLDKIREIFRERQYKEQQPGSSWHPYVGDVPVPRPGNCSQNSLALPGDTLNFILARPLMHDAVPNLGDERPRFDLTRADYRIMQILVHKQRGVGDKTYDVLFLGTDDGRVLKVVIVNERVGQYRSNFLEEVFVTPRGRPEAVVNMELIQRPNLPPAILVNTNSTVVELPLQRCGNLTECACRQDPYCVFNSIDKMCLRYDGNDYDEQNVEDIKDCPEEEVPVPQTTTPVECFCPTAQPCVQTDLSTSMPASTPTVSRTSPRSPTRAPTTPKKDLIDTSSQTTEGLSSATPSRTPRPVTKGNEIPTAPPKNTVDNSNAIDPYFGGSVGQREGPISPVFMSFFAIGWLLVLIMVFLLFLLYAKWRCKGNYQPTDTEESVFGSSYKPSPRLVQTVLPTENGKPPLMTSMQESPVRSPPPNNGSLPQSRTHSLTPGGTEPKSRSSNGSYRPPNGSFTYGMDGSYLYPNSGDRRPPTGGDRGSQKRLPSETESRPSASGASDSELNADDSEIWLKRADGSDFGQEHEV